MIKKKHMIGIVLALVMVCAMISVVDTVSAAKYKKIDSFKNKNNNGTINKFTTYYNGKTIKIKLSLYSKASKTKKSKNLGYSNIYLTKTSKKVLKMTTIPKFKNSPNVKDTQYVKTSLSSKKYYQLLKLAIKNE